MLKITWIQHVSNEEVLIKLANKNEIFIYNAKVTALMSRVYRGEIVSKR